MATPATTVPGLEAKAETEVEEKPVTETETAAEETATEQEEDKPLDAKEAKKLRDALTKANAEAAGRRVELAKLKKAEDDRLNAEKSDLQRAQDEATTAKAEALAKDQELAQLKAEKTFNATVKKLGFTFQNDKARDDAFAAMDPAAPEGFEKALKDHVKERPYVLKTVETPELDAEKKGDGSKNGKLTDAEEAALKQRFHLR